MNRVAAIQLSSTDSVEENLKTAKRLVNEAASQGATLVVLPENVALIGKTDRQKLTIAESPGEGPLQSFFSKLAQELNVWIVAGTLPIKADANRVYAACCVWNNQGQLAARYDKIHLFDVLVQPNTEYTESDTIFPGKEWVCVDSPVGKLGLSVCYDLRFPELYRKLFSEGAELFLVPAAFTEVTGKAHWEPLLRARAIENFCYVIAANQYGVHRNGRSSYGHSMIIDPWGQIIEQRETGEGVLMVEIDLDYLRDIRRRFPVSDHRRIFG